NGNAVGAVEVLENRRVDVLNLLLFAANAGLAQAEHVEPELVVDRERDEGQHGGDGDLDGRFDGRGDHVGGHALRDAVEKTAHGQRPVGVGRVHIEARQVDG